MFFDFDSHSWRHARWRCVSGLGFLAVLLGGMVCCGGQSSDAGVRAPREAIAKVDHGSDGTRAPATGIVPDGDPLSEVPSAAVENDRVSCSAELDPVSPRELFPGVRGFPARAPHTKLVVLKQGGMVFAAPSFDGYVMQQGLLLTVDGSRGVRLPSAYDRLLSRYEPEADQQTFLIGFAHEDDPCFKPGVHALDPVTLEPKFRIDAPEGWDGGTLHGVEIDGRLVLHTDVAEASSEVVALDVATFTKIWQTRASWVQHNEKTIFVEVRGAVKALDPRTGRALWTHSAARSNGEGAVFGDRYGVIFEPCVEKAAMPCRDDHVTAVVVRSSDGAVVRRQEVHTDAKALLVANDLILAEPRVLHERTALELAVYDAETGVRRWATQPTPCSWEATERYRVHFRVLGGALYACTCDGILRDYAMSDGRVRAEFSVGECRDFRVTAKGLIHSSWTYEARGGSLRKATKVEFSPVWQAFDSFAVPARPLMIEGRVDTAGLRTEASIRVGARLFPLDARGDFRAVVHGRGSLSLGVVFPPSLAREAELVIVPFDVARPSLSDVVLPWAERVENP